MDINKERGEGMGTGGDRQGDGGAEYCKCVSCGFTKKHERGTPCQKTICPKCGTPMVGVSKGEIDKVYKCIGSECEFESLETISLCPECESYVVSIPMFHARFSKMDNKQIPIIKADNEKQIVYGIVYEPDSYDADGDWATAEDIEKAAHRFMEKHQRMGVMHSNYLADSDISIVESFIAPQNMLMGGNQVKRGSWVIAAHVKKKDLWNKVKNGEFGGFSMGGTAAPAN